MAVFAVVVDMVGCALTELIKMKPRKGKMERWRVQQVMTHVDCVRMTSRRVCRYPR